MKHGNHRETGGNSHAQLYMQQVDLPESKVASHDIHKKTEHSRAEQKKKAKQNIVEQNTKFQHTQINKANN